MAYFFWPTLYVLQLEVIRLMNSAVNILCLFCYWSVNIVVQQPSSVMSSEASDGRNDDLHDKCTICLSSFEEDECVRYVFYIFCFCYSSITSAVYLHRQQCRIRYVTFRRRRFGATVSSLTVSALGLLGAGTFRHRRFGAALEGDSQWPRLPYPSVSYAGRHVSLLSWRWCPHARIADATRSKESK